MSGFGYGIGSFMEGLASGIRSGQAIGDRQRSRELEERRLQIQEDAARRDAETDSYNRSVNEKKMKWAEEDRATNAENEKADRAWQEKQHGWSEADRSRQDAERAANAPLVETTRKAAILEQEGKLKGAQTEADVRKMGDQAKTDYEGTKSKSILLGKDETGNDTYSVDGEKVASKADAEKLYEQRHGSFTDNYYTNVAPKVMESYIQNGQPEKAEQFRKYLEADQGRKAVEIGGRIMQSYLLGDIDGVNKHLNQLIRGGKYMVTDGYDVRGELLKDEGGKSVGLRVVSKNKATGEVFNKDYTGDQLAEGISGIANPTVLFEHGLQSAAAMRQQAAEANKKGIDTGADITKEAYKQMGEARQKLDEIDAPDWAKSMTPEQKDAYVQGRFKSMLNNKSIMPAQAGAPQPRTFSYGR